MKMAIIGVFLLGQLGFVAAAQAAKGGGWSFGANIGITSSDQEDMDRLISRANTREGGITTSTMGAAYELSGFMMYRFGGMFAIQFRPSYFWQTEDGKKTSSGESYDYSITGFTLFPILRMYLLENNFVKFFTQFGLGFGQMKGDVTEGAATAKFSGNNLGFMGGLGAEFCFTDAHCMTVEGNLRSLPVQRMTYDSASGTFDTDSLQQTTGGSEVEIDARDFSGTFSGIMGVIGYTMWF